MINYHKILEHEETLDPQDWTQTRLLAHRMVDDMIDYYMGVKDRPTWQPPTSEMRNHLTEGLPQTPESIEDIYQEFRQNILPYNKGNVHPRFFSWVEGGGTPLGMMSDMLAAGMNPNVTIGDHSAMYVDKQVIEWSKEMFGYPKSASGILVSGGSLANITALIVARNQYGEVKAHGLQSIPQKLTLYCSTETHNCVFKGAEAIGLGTDSIRLIPVDERFEIRMDILKAQIKEDRANGFLPFCLIGNAATVNTAAVDPLDEMLTFAQQENLWFHIDGAFGAAVKLTPLFSKRMKAIEQADSVAFDFHKWFYVNYEVGCVLIKDATKHRAAYAQAASYLTAHERGLPAGPDPIANYGMELSRGFKALKVWTSLKEHGVKKYARLILQNIAQAYYLGELVQNHPHLELLTPVTLNIVCYRYNPGGMTIEELNVLNQELLMRMHESGIAAPSYTMINGKYAIRVANCNHRSRKEDFEILVKATVELGSKIAEEKTPILMVV